MDDRGFNKVTLKNRYPIPLISKLKEYLNRANIFTKLVLKNGYYLIPMAKGNCYRTTVRLGLHPRGQAWQREDGGMTRRRGEDGRTAGRQEDGGTTGGRRDDGRTTGGRRTMDDSTPATLGTTLGSRGRRERENGVAG